MIAVLVFPYLKTLAQEQTRPEANTYYIFGRCHDHTTALGLSANVYTISNQSRQQLTECKGNGAFNAALPVSVTQLIFEANGYQNILTPVHFTTNISSHARFNIINLAMVKLDSLPRVSSEESYLALYFDVIDSINIKYKLTSLTKPSWKLQGSLFYKQLGARSQTFQIASDNYMVTISTLDGRLISNENIAIKPGVTFKSIQVAKPVDTALLNTIRPGFTSAKSSSSTTNLYFDQSSYELRPQAKVVLDSIARIMIGQLNLIATVIGYTDNVGNRNLNMSLSEYRARSVGSYLKLRGVISSQIVIKWVGPDIKALPDDVETVKATSRRVVIQLVAQ